MKTDLARRRRPAGRGGSGPVDYTVLSVKVIIAWAVVIVAVGGAVTAWLLMGHPDRDTEANRLKLDAIRTAGSIVVGTGGAAALLLAARKQRSTEIALRQKDRDQADAALAFALQQRVAADTRDDAAARRITDLYTKAVELLGSPHAPVRLGGLYALERLAQDNPGQRQTIVNVLCACLRMPCELADDAGDELPVEDVERAFLSTHHERLQEREVRLTAQRLLTAHLSPGDRPDAPLPTFWRDIDLDLTAATLVGFSLRHCTARTVVLRSVTFTGYADFASATFTGDADFGGTTFTGGANFGATTFAGDVDFEWTTFTEYVNFEAAAFAAADFEWSTFADGADFESARFVRAANFGSATFTDGADFEDTVFHDGANFGAATFTGYADFRTTVFSGATNFGAATFTTNADFQGAEFCPLPAQRTDSSAVSQTDLTPHVDFHSTTFERGIPPELTRFTDHPDTSAP